MKIMKDSIKQCIYPHFVENCRSSKIGFISQITRKKKSAQENPLTNVEVQKLDLFPRLHVKKNQRERTRWRM